jgi:hypothetical protein
MTRAPLTEEPCAAKVASTVLKASGGGDPFAEPNRAGMHWTLPGAQAMLQLRCIALNGQWEDFMRYYIDQETARLYPNDPQHRPAPEALPWAA